MKCPIDNTTLSISDRNGIEIDYCPQCRGVWLDRGELDKIIDKNNSSYQTKLDYHRSDNHRPDNHRNEYHDGYHHKKKESFLGDLFDF